MPADASGPQCRPMAHELSARAEGIRPRPPPPTSEPESVKLVRLAFVFSFWFAFANATNAQLADSDRLIERDGQLPGPPLTSGTEEGPRADNVVRITDSSSICEMMESTAVANGLPLAFFTRVIWQESRFRPDAVGPLTRGGRRARGIAQFMPSTAAERGLLDPFDPAQALPKSAEFLRELQALFGNVGLAAAAYNAGPQRVRDWLAGKRTLPSETKAFVRIVTGRTVEEWTRPEQKIWTVAFPAEIPCDEMMRLVAKPQSPIKVVPQRPTSTWAVQLFGDRSESKALASYYQLQKKHMDILGVHQPVVIPTTLKVSAVPIWNRVRIDANGRETAEMLCSRLRAVGEKCLVQRN